MLSSDPSLPARFAVPPRHIEDVQAAAAIATVPLSGLDVVFESVGRGGRYRVAHASGQLIVESTRDPIFAACRAMVSRGLAGRASFKRPGDSFNAVIVGDIRKAAEWTVRETDQHGPKFVKHREFNLG